jgi:integrase
MVQINVALKAGKFLPKVSKRRSINPYSRMEVATLFETVKHWHPRYYPLLHCVVRTGMRLGELLALQWSDLDMH